MTWRPLVRAEVRRAWTWRDEITQQIANTDIDGLLTAALLHHLKGWPLVGFYDTERLWLSEACDVPLDLGRTAWVDIDMCWPGARSVSQHVVLTKPEDAEAVEAFRHTINPNLFVGCHGERMSIYRDKYPYGTFQWAAWIAGEPSPPDPADRIRTGVAWMPDGGFMSVHHPAWRANCLTWATHTLPGSLLAPLALQGAAHARDLVVEAERSLRGSSSARHWRNHQYVMSRRSASALELLIDPALREGVRDVQGVLDAITSTYGWKRLDVPQMPRCFMGTWQFGDGQLPPGWPGAADRRDLVSFAITGNARYCWTLPDNQSGMPSLRAALAG